MGNTISKKCMNILKGQGITSDAFAAFDANPIGFLCAALAQHEEETAARPKGVQYRTNNDGTEILTQMEDFADHLANFLECMGYDVMHTSYYDPSEDARNGETDDDTGWYCVYPD